MNTEKHTQPKASATAEKARKLDPDTLRSIEAIRRNGYYVRSQTMGDGGWPAIHAEIADWKSYWLSAEDNEGTHFDDSITAKDDKAAKAAFASMYHLDQLAFYSIHELTKSNREITD